MALFYFYFSWEWLQLVVLFLEIFPGLDEQGHTAGMSDISYHYREEKGMRQTGGPAEGSRSCPEHIMGKSVLRPLPLMGITKKHAWGIDRNNWECRHAQKSVLFTLKFSKSWTHLPKCLIWGENTTCKEICTEKKGHISTYSFIITLP